MPIYDYRCTKCNLDQQHICDFDEADDMVCEVCEGKLLRGISLFAKTVNRWGDTNGYFDRGLGMHIENSMHREKVMKEKGLRPVTQKELDDEQQEVYNETIRHEKQVETFNRVKKQTGSFAEAAKAITGE